MRRLALAIYLLFAAVLFAPGMARADNLEISITNVREGTGVVMFTVVNEAGFQAQQAPLISVMIQAAAPSVSLRTDALPAGTYAIRVMQDLNGNGELDSNILGIPNEPWAFSNNATGKFGPPGWKDVHFTLEGSAVQKLHLN